MDTETKRVYSLEIEGTQSVNDLKNAIEQLNDKLKTLNETSKEYKDTLSELIEYQSKLSDAMQGISTSAEKTDNSLTNIKNTVDNVAESISNLGDNVIGSFVQGFAEGMAEAASNTAEMNENTEKSVNSVKDLKQQISDLRDRLVSLDKDSEEYKTTVKSLIDDQVKLKEVMDAGKNEVEAADGSYNALSQRMSALKKVWKETTDEVTRNEIGKQINDINNQLKAMDASIGNNQRNVGNYKSALDGVKGSFSNLRQELKATKEAMQQLDPNTKEYSEAMARAAEITHQLSYQQEMIKYSSPDLGDQLSNIRGIASNLVAGYSALNAAMGLFGKKNEDVQKAMLKVQQAMALVQGLQGIDGFIKRTQGLSQSLGLVTKATQANTVATKANATVSKQDAAAKTAEAAATSSVVPAQLSLNAAMKANPIGFVIGLIAALVAAFTLLKDNIMNMIGASEKLTKSFEKFKVVISGVAGVLKNYLITPIKFAIVELKTFGKVLNDVFTLKWGKIGKDLKGGVEETVDIVKNGLDVVNNYKEAANKKQSELDDKKRKEDAAKRQKELEGIIKDNEAKENSDWKYTEEAKKLYDELFEKRMAQYSSDSEEYREAQRDKWAYDRDFTERQNKESEKAIEDERKRQEQAAKEAKQLRETMLSDFKNAFSSLVPEWTKITINITDLYKKWEDGADLFKEELIKKLEITSEDANKIINQMYSKMKKSIYGDMAKTMRDGYEKEFYDFDRNVSSWLSEVNAKFEENKLKIGIEMPNEALRHFNDIFETQAKNIRKQINEVDGVIKKFYNNIIEADAEYSGFTVEQLAKEIPEFQKMLDKKSELEGKYTKLRIENFKQNTEIIKGEYDKELSSIEYNYERRKQLLENYFDWVDNERKSIFSDNEIEDIKRSEKYYSKYYSMLIKFYEEQREKYIEMSNDITLTAEERKNAEDKAGELTIKIRQAEYDKELSLMKKRKELYKGWSDMVKDTISSIVDIMSSISDSWGSIINLEKEAINTELENGKISKEEADRREEQNKQSFEDLKKFQIAQAIINSLSAAVSAYQSMSSIPYVGPVLGAAAAAAALAAGYANVKQIEATSYGGGSSSSSSSTNFQLPNVMELEPQLRQNKTGMDDTDILNNIVGEGKKETVIKAYVLESDLNAAQKLAAKRSSEITF